MRVDGGLKPGLKQVWILYSDGSRAFQYEQLVSNQSGAVFSRSDIQKGNWEYGRRWREPTTYSFDALEQAGWFGDYYYQAYPSDFKRLFSGALQDSFAALPQWPDLDWPPYPGSLSSQAEIACLLQARDMKIDLSSAFAEGRKCVSGIAERTIKVLDAFTLTKKGNWRGASRVLGYTPNRKRMGKSTASDWLELQYGWLPFLSDIHGLHEEFNRDTVINAFRFTVRSIAKEPIDVNRRNAGNSAGSEALYSVTGYKYYRCCLTYEVSDDTYIIASRIGLTNPAELAWNLLPYSFVTDWFLPVGDWLGAMTAALGLRFISGTGSRGSKFTWSGETVADGSAHYVVSDVKCSGTRHSGGRGIYPNNPMPLPYFKNPLSTTHVANAVALIQGVRR